jgi:AraC-like DNA-binding protein
MNCAGRYLKWLRRQATHPRLTTNFESNYSYSVDLISNYFERLRLRGKIFYTGKVDGVLDVKREPGTALVHLLPEGGVELLRPDAPSLAIVAPGLLLSPEQLSYRLRSAGPQSSPIVCASFELGCIIGDKNPLGLEQTLMIGLDAMPHLRLLIDLVLHEVNTPLPAREKALSALFEYMLVQLVRFALQQRMINRGSLAGLLDPKIGRALEFMHNQPEEEWDVARLAQLCGMSRSAFSSRFVCLTGVPPIAYLAAWRIRLAQTLMFQGTALKVVASAVGYGSQAAFTRAFAGQCGLPPGEWLRMKLPS